MTKQAAPELVAFSEFMARALYGPGGFYSGGGSAGRRGDFITSVEVGPLFGAVVARYLDTEWRRLGSPDDFFVVEVGAGPGTLARSIRDAQPACWEHLHYVTVEVSERQRDRQPEWVTSLATMPRSIDDVMSRTGGTDQGVADSAVAPQEAKGVVVANELLDNMPFELAVYDGGWRLAFVSSDGDRWNESLGPTLDPLPSVLPVRAAHGARAPLQLHAASWVSEAVGLFDHGSVLVFDYGVPLTVELAVRPWRDWLRTYRGHERGNHYLLEPGSQDITADVAFDQLPAPDAMRPQGQWLKLHGIDELVDEGKQYWQEHAAAPDLHAMKMRSRISEAEALLDPSGLGAFWVLEWRS